MTYEKNPFKYENIPDYAMKPAQETANIDNTQIDQFDPTPYDRILGGHQPYDSEPMTRAQSADKEEFTTIEKKDYNWENIGAREPEITLEAFNEVQPEATPIEELVVQTIEEPVILAEESASPVDAVILAEEPVAQPTEMPVIQPTEIPVMQPVEVPVSGPLDEIAAQPVTAPPAKVSPIKIIPIVGSLVSSKLKLVDVKDKAKTKVYVEEDVLVPDVKPDLSTILAMEGKVRLSDKEISAGQAGADYVKVTGDLTVETLYIPDTSESGENIVSIESRLPFKSDCTVGAAPNSKLVVQPEIESLDYTIINERKVRIKAVVALGMKEYGSLDVDLFEGVKGEEVQMLKERIRATDVAMRKTQPVEIKEDLLLKDSMPEIERILKYNVNVVENHKQVAKDKAVINASLYCNVMYLGASPNSDISKANEMGDLPVLEPVLYQGKTEFTQFMKLSDDIDTEGKNLVGSKVDFDVSSFNLSKKVDDDGKTVGFDLESSIDTTLELYQNVEKEIVTDVYHNIKDIQYETEDLGLMSLSGTGASEVSVREIINIPDQYGPVDRIVYMSGDVKETNSNVDNGKASIEGVATINLICVSADENKSVYNLKQEIPFRSNIDISGAREDMTCSNQLTLKDLWFDKINTRQVEVNAGIAVSTTVNKEEKHKLIKNVSFVEMPESEENSPSIILYIAKAGDNIWKIAKRYRTTIDEIKKINELEYVNEIKPGTKLLIVAKSH